ncbi:MAG: hypothetical protein F4169_20425 [Gammaproteobacteria bacterium]|nr:hypothetical protein [Gammaproteobacteria bacterium]
MIDTLRFANRLKEAGVDPRQAEAMSSAFNDEISEGVATKRDLDNAVTELKGEMAERFANVDARLGSMDAKFEAKFVAVDARFEAMDAKFDSRFEAMDAKFESMDARFEAMDARFEAMDTKFEAMDTKFEAMDTKFESLAGRFGTQGRYTFLVLALIAALGLYNAAAPHFMGKQPGTVTARPAPTT